MLKVRVLPTLLYKEVGLVKGIGFDSWRRVGGVMQAVKVYNMRDVDELALLDITASLQSREPDFQLIDDIADECFMPLAVGGGVRTTEHVERLLRAGADKVIVNTAAVEQPELVHRIADRFGSQCVVVGIDVAGSGEVRIASGTRPTGLDPVAHAVGAERSGAGEILLTSIERDGTMEGYDVDLLRRVADAVSIPVIASGGAGTYEHMAEAIQSGHASAVAAASMFHFTEQTPLEAKRYLREQGIATRL